MGCQGGSEYIEIDVKPGWCGITIVKPRRRKPEDASKDGAEERAQDMQARHLQTLWKPTINIQHKWKYCWGMKFGCLAAET